MPRFKLHCNQHSKIFMKHIIISSKARVENLPCLEDRNGIVVFGLWWAETDVQWCSRWWLNKFWKSSCLTSSFKFELPWKRAQCNSGRNRPYSCDKVLAMAPRRFVNGESKLKDTSSLTVFQKKFQVRKWGFESKWSFLFWWIVARAFPSENESYILGLTLLKCV